MSIDTHEYAFDYQMHKFVLSTPELFVRTIRDWLKACERKDQSPLVVAIVENPDNGHTRRDSYDGTMVIALYFHPIFSSGAGEDIFPDEMIADDAGMLKRAIEAGKSGLHVLNVGESYCVIP